MKCKWKRLLSFFLIFVIVFSLLPPIPVSAKSAYQTGWLWPVPSSRMMSRGYYMNRPYYDKKGKLQYEDHDAIDIRPPKGVTVTKESVESVNSDKGKVEVVAAKAGTIVTVYEGCNRWSAPGTCTYATCDPNHGLKDGLCNNGFGRGLVIEHEDGSRSYYAHMGEVLFEESAENKTQVLQGQLLGYMGSYGASSGPHLHFTITKGSTLSTRINNSPSSASYGISIESNYDWSWYNLTGSNGYRSGYAYNSVGVDYIFERDEDIEYFNAYPQKVTVNKFMQTVKDGIAVRSTPRSNPNNIVANVAKGTQLYIGVKSQNTKKRDWYRIGDGAYEGCYVYVPNMKELSGTGTHTHSFGSSAYESAHPHKAYQQCTSCSYIQYSGSTKYVASCATCNTAEAVSVEPGYYYIRNKANGAFLNVSSVDTTTLKNEEVVCTIPTVDASHTMLIQVLATATGYKLQIYDTKFAVDFTAAGHKANIYNQSQDLECFTFSYAGKTASDGYYINSVSFPVECLTAAQSSIGRATVSTRTKENSYQIWYLEPAFSYWPPQYVYFDANGGHVTTSSKTYSYGEAYGTLPTPTRNGYRFLGWYTAAVGGDKITSNTTAKLSAPRTLYAHWEAKSYKVKFDANGGSVNPSTKNVTFGSRYGELPTPTRTGYEFDGWYFNQTLVTSNSLYSTANAITLTAQWKPTTCTVTFDSNGGDIMSESHALTHGEPYGVLPVPTRDGYIFNGWFTMATGGTKVTEETIVKHTSSHTLYAQWTLKTYPVSYDANGGSDAPDTQIKRHGYPLELSPTTPVRHGYIFIGWNTECDGSGIAINSAASYSDNAPLHLYAQWKDANITYTITYDSNNSSYQFKWKQTKSYNVDVYVMDCASNRPYYSFSCWNTKSDGSGTTFLPGDPLYENIDMTLYALWEPQTDEIYLDPCGGTVESESVFLQYDTAIQYLPTPSKDGYIFLGWFAGEAEDAKQIHIGSTYLASFGDTLYAHWKEENPVISSGTCNDGAINWFLYQDGSLKFEGNGSLGSYTEKGSGAAPWKSGGSYRINRVTISDGITEIGSYAFSNCSALEEISLPPSLTVIGYRSFYNCSSLESIILPENLETIAAGAFVSTGIRALHLPASLRSFDMEMYIQSEIERFSVDDNSAAYSADAAGVLYNKNQTQVVKYPSASSAKSYQMPDTVTSVGKYAFAEARNLTEISMSENLRVIYYYAFMNCSGLKSLVLPASVYALEQTVFMNCKNLERVVIKGTNMSIREGTFYGCDKLTEIILPESISSRNFGGMFSGCRSLEQADLPEGITYIPSNMYNNCVSLTEIILPSTITSISASAFESCSGIRSFDLPNEITSIQHRAFARCSALESLVLPESLTSLGYCAFIDCSNLEYVVFPNNALTITAYGAYDLFTGCEKLQALYFLGDAPICTPADVFGNLDVPFYVLPGTSGWDDIGWDGYNIQPWPTCYVNYDANGGSGAMDSVSVCVNTSKTIENNEFQKEGYSFIAWNTLPDGTGNDYSVESNIQLASSSSPRITSDTTLWSVDGEATLFAQWTPNQYAVTWNVDGFSTTEYYLYGEMPSHITPTKDGSAVEEYVFVGWDNELEPVQCDVTYTAIFETSKKLCDVTFRVDEEVYAESTVAFGSVPAEPVPPDKPGYIFAGWTPKIIAASQESVTYDAIWIPRTDTFTVTWVFQDEDIIIETYTYGELPAAPKVPDSYETEDFSYSFYGWDLELVPVTEDVTYNALFLGTMRSYTVYFVLDYDTVYSECTVLYGKIPAFPEDPVREGYTFLGWDRDASVVTGDTCYYAKWNVDGGCYGGTATCKDRAVCAECGKAYGALGDHNYGTLIAAQAEIHTQIELKAAVAAHYFCDICDTYFTEGKVETTLDALTAQIPEHSYSDWITTDANCHWKTCSCGLKNEEGAHCYTHTTDTICDICGYERIVGHEHTFSTTLSYDKTNHWYAATCGHNVTREIEAHVWSDGICSVCNSNCEHVYGDATFNWQADCSAVKVTVTCSCCEDKQTLDCEVSSQWNAESGTLTFTATAEEGAYTDTQTIKLTVIDGKLTVTVSAIGADDATNMVIMIVGYNANGQMTGCQIIDHVTGSTTETLIVSGELKIFFLKGGTYAPLFEYLKL